MERYIPLDFVRQHALKSGFQACGAAKAGILKSERLNLWLSNGYHAAMEYMERNKEKRIDIKQLVPYAETIFSFLISYNGNQNKAAQSGVAAYALGEDYHKVLKIKLYNLLQIIQSAYPDFEARVFVDSAPLMERQWAVKAGLGWIGKNGCLINRTFGSRTFLAEMVCNYTSDYCEEQKNRCGTCKRCIESCPNHAIEPNGIIDSNRCISYQTIENKAAIPDGIRLQGYVYGCDICLNACIWNKKAPKYRAEEFTPSSEMLNLIDKIKNGSLEKQDFNKARKHSSIERVKFDKLLSNINAAQSEVD